MASDQTQERRERVRELIAKPPRSIAQILIEEGYFGSVPRTTDAKRTHLDSSRRQVARDIEWWREQWKKEKREITAADFRSLKEEHIARLESRLIDVEEVLSDAAVKSTPRVQAIDTAVRIEQAIGKARGVDEPPKDQEPPGDDAPKVPFLGIVVGLNKLSPEAKKKIDEWSGGKRS